MRFCSLPSRCSARRQQACARGSQLLPHSNPPEPPRLEERCLEHTKRFLCGRRGELACFLLGRKGVAGVAAASAAVPCQLPPPTSQAPYSCTSLEAKRFQATCSGNPSANQATTDTNKIRVPHSVLYGLRKGGFLGSNNPTKILLRSYSPITSVSLP